MDEENEEIDLVIASKGSERDMHMAQPLFSKTLYISGSDITIIA